MMILIAHHYCEVIIIVLLFCFIYFYFYFHFYFCLIVIFNFIIIFVIIIILQYIYIIIIFFPSHHWLRASGVLGQGESQHVSAQLQIGSNPRHPNQQIGSNWRSGDRLELGI